MKESILILSHTDVECRLRVYIDDDKLSLYRADDVCSALGIQSASHATREYDSDENRIVTMPTNGGPQKCIMLTERGVVSVILKSNKAKARPFRKMIMDHLMSSHNMNVEKMVIELKYLREQVSDIVRERTAEKDVRDCIADEVNGTVEYKTPCGRADVVSDTEIIEVKHFKQWKHALGQVLAYADTVLGKQKRIHLFADDGDMLKAIDLLPIARQVCDKFNVRVTLEVRSLDSDKHIESHQQSAKRQRLILNDQDYNKLLVRDNIKAFVDSEMLDILKRYYKLTEVLKENPVSQTKVHQLGNFSVFFLEENV